MTSPWGRGKCRPVGGAWAVWGLATPALGLPAGTMECRWCGQRIEVTEPRDDRAWLLLPARYGAIDPARGLGRCWTGRRRPPQRGTARG